MKQTNLLVVSLAILIPALVLSQTQGRAKDENKAEDEALIRKEISLGEQAWNKHDAAALATQLTEDVDHINVLGGWNKGREAIHKEWARLFATFFKDDVVKMTPEKFRFLKPDVAVVIVRINHTQVAAESLGTLVMTKKGDKWQIVSFQATQVRKVPSEK